MYNRRSTSKNKQTSATNSNSLALYSAALQDHFLKKMNFDVEIGGRIPSHKRTTDKLPAIQRKDPNSNRNK
jgi:hypothetical protein